MTANNLHRELAPISDAAWDEIEDDARTQFTRTIAGRRVVDVTEPKGLDFSALSTGRLTDGPSATDGVETRTREVYPVVELKVPFTLERAELDAVLRGAVDADVDAVRAAARRIAIAEDRIVFHSTKDGAIPGIVRSSDNEPVELPSDTAELPGAVAEALNRLRREGVEGPYNLLLSEELYTKVLQETDHGYPIRQHIERVLREDGRLIWAPALDGALLVSARGGDYELHLGQDLSIGYTSSDANAVELYLQESFTFAVASEEAGVAIAEPN